MAASGIQYGPSHYGASVVVAEPPLNSTRWFMVIATTLSGLALLGHLLGIILARHCSRPRAAPPARMFWIVSLLYALAVITSTWHYADNIARPVKYSEPEWLYKRWVWSEMELTFVFWWPEIALAAFGIHRVLRADTGTDHAQLAFSAQRLLSGCNLLMAFGLCSLISAGHYWVHPFAGYDAMVNGSIADEIVCSMTLLVFVAWLHRQFNDVAKRRLSDPEPSSSSVAASAASCSTASGSGSTRQQASGVASSSDQELKGLLATTGDS